MSELESPAREAERQLVAAVERHRELMAAVAVAGRPAQSRHAAATALARGVQLMAFTLTRAAAAGVPRERLVELTGGEPSVVEAVLDGGPDQSVVEWLTPGGVIRVRWRRRPRASRRACGSALWCRRSWRISKTARGRRRQLISTT